MNLLNNLPVVPPADVKEPLIFSVYRNRNGSVKVGTGASREDRFHVGFTSGFMLEQIANAQRLGLSGGHSVFQMDATFKINYNEFPLVVCLILLLLKLIT